MNIQPDNQKQSISDDQELAKALAGVNDEVNTMGFGQPTDSSAQGTDVTATDAGMSYEALATPAAPATPSAPASPATAADDPALASVKQDALNELRPLIDKLDVDPEEKFNTYLLLIRSTDDKDLIAPAHEAAKGITDESKKAQALLDIIKEIDFLSNPNQNQ